MKNIDIIENAKKAHGITLEVNTFIGWKYAGYNVKKGERSVFSAELWVKAGRKWIKKETHFFTSNQVKPINEKPEEKPTETNEKPETADVAPATPEASEYFRIIENDRFYMTCECGKVKATFRTAGIASLNKKDFAAFVKKYVNVADDKTAVIAYLMNVVKPEYQTILTGKKAKNTEVKKAINVISKGERVFAKKQDGKCYITDGRMIIETSEEDADDVTEVNETLRKAFESTKADMDLKKLMNNIFGNERTGNVNFRNCITEKIKGMGKVYQYDDHIAASSKYVDAIANKEYETAGKYQPIVQTGATYRVAICPIKLA